jgi:predicted permease
MVRTESASTFVTILTLAVAIAANTTIFAVGNALLFKRTPGVAEPQQLVNIGRTVRGSGFDSLSYPDVIDYRNRNSVFSDLAAYSMGETELGLRGGNASERVSALLVTDNLFGVLGTTPALGRFFDAADNTVSSPPAAVISYGLWKSQFGGSDSVLGRQIPLNGQSVTIVGVAQEGAHGPDLRQVDVFLPLAMRNVVTRATAGFDLMQARSAVWLEGVARLKPSTSIEQANSDMSVIAGQLQAAYPETNRNRGVTVIPYFPIPGQHRPAQLFLTLLLSIVALVLLIACANVAGIGLARASARKREVALRFALGAGRVHILSQLLLETLVTFSIAGAMGLVTASWVASLLSKFKTDSPVAVAVDLSLDGRVALFTFVLTLVAALAAGLGPALTASHTDVGLALKEESMSLTGRRSRLRRALVVAQVSLSLVLLVTGGLFARTLLQTDLTRPGFNPDRVQVVSLDFMMAGYDEAQGGRFAQTLLGRLRSLPGVESASLAHDLPLDMGAFSMGGINVDGHQPPSPFLTFAADWNIVSPGYFRTLELPLLRGRDFTDDNRAGTPSVAIINKTMADQFWPGEDPIGKRFYRGLVTEGDILEVIGVAADTQNRVVGDRPNPFVYVPLSQVYNSRQFLVLRTAGRADVIPQVRGLLRELNSNLPIVSVRTMDQVIEFSMVPQRAAAFIIGGMGLVGLLLASIGIYGICSQSVNSRTREIGIRVALGARRTGVLGLILREGLLLSVAGLALGLIGAALVGQVIRAYLYSVGPTDLVAFSVATLTLVAAALIASFLPARRATKVDPMTALRHN